MSWIARRSYKAAAVAEEDEGFSVSLDGRPIKTPAGAPLRAPTRALGEAVAAEWNAQKEKIDPRSMPLTRLLSTAIDRVGPDRNRAIDQIAAYAATDLVCYRAEQPADLVRRQEEVWRGLLDWAERAHGARLRVTRGVVPVKQDPEALRMLRAEAARLSDVELSALASATAAAGSLVVGLALLAGEIDAGAAFEAAELDASFQIERWGEDAEAAGRRARLLDDLNAIERFVMLARA